MTGFYALGEAALGEVPAAVDVVNIASAWTEGPDSVALVANLGSAVSSAASWAEAADSIAMTGSVGALPGVTIAAGWVEARDAISLTAALDAPVYAHAPAGDGYHPRAGAHQNRPPALQGYFE